MRPRHNSLGYFDMTILPADLRYPGLSLCLIFACGNHEITREITGNYVSESNYS